MKKQLVHFSLVAIVALSVMFSLSGAALAQSPDAQQPQTAPQTQSPDAQSPQTQPSTPSSPAPETPSQAQPPATPDQGQATSAPSHPDASGSQEFIGTVVKQGDKYMFQDASSGTTYDIDHQDDVKKFEGKRVKFHGSLDAATKTIHVQQ